MAEKTAESWDNLEELISGAQPGDTILVPNFEGDEVGPYLKFGKDLVGEPDAKITIRALEPVKINGFKLNGKHIVVDGFQIAKGVEIKGQYCRITNCEWDDAEARIWVFTLPGCFSNEIDHCRFANKTNNLKGKKSGVVMQMFSGKAEIPQQWFIHHNFFDNIPRSGKNGFETIQIRTVEAYSKGSAWENPRTWTDGKKGFGALIAFNHFNENNGEAELISFKVSYNTVYRNRFDDCQAQVVTRGASACSVVGNVFNASSLRIQGSHHHIENNMFRGAKPGIAVHAGGKVYSTVRRSKILHNTFRKCPVAMELGAHGRKNGWPPEQLTVAGNMIDGCKTPFRTKKLFGKHLKEPVVIGNAGMAGSVPGLPEEDMEAAFVCGDTNLSGGEEAGLPASFYQPGEGGVCWGAGMPLMDAGIVTEGIDILGNPRSVEEGCCDAGAMLCAGRECPNPLAPLFNVDHSSVGPGTEVEGPAPTVKILTPSEGDELSATYTVEVAADGSASGDDLLYVELFHDGNPLGAKLASAGDNSGTFSWDITEVALPKLRDSPQGVHVLRAMAIDSKLRVAVSDVVSIQWTESPEECPAEELSDSDSDDGGSEKAEDDGSDVDDEDDE